MDQEKINRLVDLIEEIKQVDSMVQLHAANPSKTMYEQYIAKKLKLTSYLIDELVSPDLVSLQSYSIISSILARFYPNLRDQAQISDATVNLSELEAVLA